LNGLKFDFLEEVEQGKLHTQNVATPYIPPINEEKGCRQGRQFLPTGIYYQRNVSLPRKKPVDANENSTDFVFRSQI